MSTDLTLFSQTRQIVDLRPDDVKKAVFLAQEQGIDVQNHSGFQSAFEHLQNEAKKREDKFSPASISRFYSAWEVFVSWCIQHNQPSLPTTPKILEDFFKQAAETKHRQTLGVYRWAIGRMHRISGCPDPFLDEFLKDTLAGISRMKVSAGEQIAQATPFNGHHLDQLIELWGGHKQLVCRRDLALLTVAYETLLRETELCNIRIQDLKINRARGTATLTIPVTKTNHSGKPDTAHLSNECVSLLLEYADMAGFSLRGKDKGYVFRGVSKHNTSIQPKVDPLTKAVLHTPLTRHTVIGIFEKAFYALNMQDEEDKPWSGHSARVGGAQDLLLAGYSIPAIQQAGRWKSEIMVYRYCRDILAEQGAMAQHRSHRIRNKEL